MNYPRTIVIAIIAVACTLTIPQASVATKQQSRMVMLHVRVTDSTGKAVANVPQTGIVVTEDGVPQKIEVFINDETPISYGLVIDSSASVRPQYVQVMNSAERIVESNRPTDDTFLIRFISSDKIEIAQEPTSDKALLIKSLRDSFYLEGGQSAVIDAVYLSANKFAQLRTDVSRPRRRVLVLITDGENRDSYYDTQALFKFLASTDVQVFTIALTKDLKPASRDKAINLLTRLGDATGGQTFFVSSDEEIERIANQILNEIRTQYVIGYVPTGIDAGKDFHKIQVSLTGNPNDKRVAVTRVDYSISTDAQTKP